MLNFVSQHIACCFEAPQDLWNHRTIAGVKHRSVWPGFIGFSHLQSCYSINIIWLRNEMYNFSKYREKLFYICDIFSQKHTKTLGPVHCTTISYRILILYRILSIWIAVKSCVSCVNYRRPWVLAANTKNMNNMIL